MNIFDVRLTDDGAHIGDYTVPVPRAPATSSLARAPRAQFLASAPNRCMSWAQMRASRSRSWSSQELGSDAYAYGNLHFGHDSSPLDKMFIARVDTRRPPPMGETIHLRIRESEEHVFNPETGERIDAAAASRV
jgi:multiple sugar transport system ATP-binding protein